MGGGCLNLEGIIWGNLYCGYLHSKQDNVRRLSMEGSKVVWRRNLQRWYCIKTQTRYCFYLHKWTEIYYFREFKFLISGERSVASWTITKRVLVFSQAETRGKEFYKSNCRTMKLHRNFSMFKIIAVLLES